MSTMTQSQNRPQATMSDIKSDAAAVRKDLATLRDDAVDVGAHAAHEVAERVKTGAAHVSEYAQTAGEQAKAAHKAACEHVSKHPTAAVLVALGAGAVLGRMLWR